MSNIYRNPQQNDQPAPKKIVGGTGNGSGRIMNGTGSGKSSGKVIDPNGPKARKNAPGSVAKPPKIGGTR